ncbi:hypothetical protein BD324DRAFT_234849 [Kockovaella imperatae]|uniref:Uncharacterized protein n=1 Tax=Kockovaella imperatae TaxID=4999 RepID=A0A1Y1UP42_9TREE|nr:hypothetical protein BD324DRAFT_234849 [Kockovaella imperatae]ORX39789.1 hypothetical protein BD324DRAFT_234849 [Kockovaella imperatae]
MNESYHPTFMPQEACDSLVSLIHRKPLDCDTGHSGCGNWYLREVKVEGSGSCTSEDLEVKKEEDKGPPIPLVPPASLPAGLLGSAGGHAVRNVSTPGTSPKSSVSPLYPIHEVTSQLSVKPTSRNKSQSRELGMILSLWHTGPHPCRMIRGGERLRAASMDAVEYFRTI